MKKNLLSILTLVLLALFLTACGKKAAEITVTPAELAKQLAEETVTSDTLTEVSADTMTSTYMIDSSQIDDSSTYMSTGSSACAVSVIKCTDSSYASSIQETLKSYVDDRAELYSSYDAAQTTKLEAALIKVSGQYVVLCVCDDTDAAEKILKEAGF